VQKSQDDSLTRKDPMPTAAHPTWKDAGVDASVHDALATQLKGSALRSLLLSVAQRRAMARGPSDVLQQFEQDRFVGIAPVDQRTLRRLELTLLEVADAYDAVELSPVAPLGTCVAVAPGSQNRIVSTMRGTEVVSDPTNVLAIECARRLRADPAATVRLATAHRCVRAQSVPAGRGMAAHFSMFCLATAAHETADQAFAAGALAEHMLVYLSALERLENAGYRFGHRKVRLLSTPACVQAARRIEQQLRARHPALAVEHQALTSAYYDGLRFVIDMSDVSDAIGAPARPTPLIDGGAFDWVGQLAANRKFRYVASAMGTQLATALFRE
jgi:hypothetical protein